MELSSTLIVLGGDNLEQSKDVEYYNPVADEWTKILTLDVNRDLHKCVILEGNLVIVGGRNNTASNIMQSYNFLTGIMTTLSPFKEPRYYHQVSVLARHLYVIGGFNGEEFFGTVERYDPFTDTWTDVLQLQTIRNGSGGAVLNGEIYAIGGYNRTDGQLASVESYNPTIGTWKYCASMHEKRDHSAVATRDNLIYVVGGYNGTDQLNTAECYNPYIDRWTFIHTVSVPRWRAGACYFNNSIIYAGGMDINTTHYSTVEWYNIKDNTWTTKAPLTTPRAYVTVLEVPLTYITPILASKAKISK